MRRVTSWAVCGVLILSTLVGCQPIATMLYVLGGAGQVKAEYPGLEGKRVVVVCHTLAELQVRNASVAKEIAKQVGRRIRQEVPKVEVVDDAKVARWIDENNGREDYISVGKGLKADMVIGVDLESFSVNSGSTLYQGVSNCSVAVYDIKAGGEQVWEKNPLPKIVYPPHTGVPVSDLSEQEFRKKFVVKLSEAIAHYFYDHPVAEQFAETDL